MDQPLYEPDNRYAYGRSILLFFLILMPLICFLPSWIFPYQWNEHFMVESKNLEQKPRISKGIDTIPEPRLQSQPRDDLARYRMEENRKLQSYSWVNREAGLVRIPIDEAMDRYLREERK